MFADEIASLLSSLIYFFLCLSTWTYILVSYWNQENPPALILGVGAALIAKYGLDKVPSLINTIQSWVKHKVNVNGEEPHEK